jgi:hypothetical protein
MRRPNHIAVFRSWGHFSTSQEQGLLTDLDAHKSGAALSAAPCSSVNDICVLAAVLASLRFTVSGRGIRYLFPFA